MKNLGAILMTAVMLIGLLPGTLSLVSADIEPNSTFLTAEVLPTGTPMNGAINGTDEDDYYKFNVINGQRISVTLETGGGPDDLWGQLSYPDQGSIHSTDWIAPGTSETREFTTALDNTGFYYYRVTGGTSTYTLTATLTHQNDAGSGLDAGDDDLNAYPITPGSHSGWIADDDEKDYYQFAVVTAQIITITLNVGTTMTDDLYFGVFDHEKNSIDTSEWIAAGLGETIEYTTSMATQGTYYICVQGGDNDYTLVLDLTDQDDADQGIDAADDLTAPTMVDLAVEHEGWISDDDENDVYGFHVVDGQKITFILKTGTKTDQDLYAQIFGPDKDSIESTEWLNPDISETIKYTTSYATAGLYYVKVKGGDNNYFFTFSVEDQDDANSGVDALDDFPGLVILEGASYPGWIADDDGHDYYGVNVTNGQKIGFTLKTGTATTDDLWAYMYDTGKNSIGSTDYLNPDVSETLSYTTSFETPGLYYFKVGGGDNSYSFDLEVIDQDDAGIGMDAPETLVDSVALTEGTFTGWVADADNADAYNFTVKGGNVFTVNVTTGGSGTSSLTYKIYDPAKNVVTSLYVASGVTESYTLPVDKAPIVNSVYFIQVSGDALPYTIDLVLPQTPPDMIPPKVTILTPAAGTAFIAGPITLTGTATDDGTVTKVEASIDNTTWKVCTGLGAWTCIINISDGSNKVTIRATDAGNNRGYDDVTVHKDGTPPTVTITSLENGSKVKKKETLLSGTATDNIGLAKVEISINGGTWLLADGTGTWSLLVTLSSGDNTIKVRVTDAAGNTLEETIEVKYKKPETKKDPGFEAVVFIAAGLVALLILVRRRK